MSSKPEDTTDIEQSLVSEYCKLNPYEVYLDIQYLPEEGKSVGISPPKEVVKSDSKFDEAKIHISEAPSKLLTKLEYSHFAEDEEKSDKLDPSSYAKYMDKVWRKDLKAFKTTLQSVMESDEYHACQADNARYSLIAASGIKGLKQVAVKAVEDSGIKYEFGPESDLYKALAGKSSSFIAQKLLEKMKKEPANTIEAGAVEPGAQLGRFHPMIASKMVKIGRKMAEMEETEKEGGLKATKLKVMNHLRNFFNGVCRYRGKNIDASLEQFKNDLKSPRYAMDKLKMQTIALPTAPSKATTTRGR